MDGFGEKCEKTVREGQQLVKIQVKNQDKSSTIWRVRMYPNFGKKADKK